MKRILITLLMLLTIPIWGWSQDTEVNFTSQYRMEIVLTIALLVCILALTALIVALFAMRTMMRARTEELGQEPQTQEIITVRPGMENVGFWTRFWNRVNVSVPVAHEKDVATDHEYDGIKELDNRLPPWWLYGFYFTIAFGVVYLIHFHVLGTGLSQEEEYVAQIEQAEASKQAFLAAAPQEIIDENNVTFLSEQEVLVAGEVIFQANCAVCHGQEGQGGVGPNMTDEYWIHGGDMASIFSVIKYGAANGMLPWQTKLTPKQMQQVSSYVYSMEGTNPPNQKAPQGEVFIREPAQEADSASVNDAVNASL